MYHRYVDVHYFSCSGVVNRLARAISTVLLIRCGDFCRA